MAIRKFDGPIQFFPIQSPPPTFRLALYHILPSEHIPSGINPNVTEDFSIDYDESDLKDAVILMMDSSSKRKPTDGNGPKEDSGEQRSKRVKG